ncbi:CCA tRNA nucleotidyltransferase, partial [candidate division KSB1 bacterium]
SRKPTVTKGDLYTDLERRDFTINTLTQKLTSSGPGEILDKFNGLEDIENSIIRTPLDPEKTFTDDPLRMIRAIRFVTLLGFDLDKTIFNAIKSNRDRIKIVSQERITDEFLKIINADTPSVGLELLRKTCLLEILFPNLQRLIGVDQRGTHHHKDVWFHTIKVIDNVAEVSDKTELRLAALYHDIAKPATKKFIEGTGWTFYGHDVLGARMIRDIILRLKLPSDYISYIQKLTRLHLRPINLTTEDVTDSAIRRLIVKAGYELEDLLVLCRADITSGNPKRVKKHLDNFDFVRKRIQEVEDLDKLRAFKSPVDGNEIMQVCKLKPSPEVGKIKKMIEEAILDGIIPNEHDAAYDYMLKIKDGLLNSN